jgi:hypothetical protein
LFWLLVLKTTGGGICSKKYGKKSSKQEKKKSLGSVNLTNNVFTPKFSARSGKLTLKAKSSRVDAEKIQPWASGFS